MKGELNHLSLLQLSFIWAYGAGKVDEKFRAQFHTKTTHKVEWSTVFFLSNAQQAGHFLHFIE